MKKWLLIAFTLMMVAVLAACGAKEEATDANAAKADGKETETITVKHELGETTFDKDPKKVVVFDFGILDSMDQLGLEESVAGVPQASIPAYLEKYADTEKYENIGTLKEADFEAINAMEPDLIIISGRQADMYPEFEKIAPTINMAVDTTKYMESFEANMNTLGDIFGKEDQVKEELAAVEKQIEDLKTSITDEKALIVLANEGKVSAYGAASRFGIIHDVFGVKQADEGIEASTHGQSISFEYILETNPDMMFVVDRNAAVGNEASAKDSLENELVQKTNAYKNDNIIYLDPDFWYLSGGGFQSVSQMVKDIQAAFK